jgi:hypothetical protein
MDIPKSITADRVALGAIGKVDDPIGSVVSKNLAAWIPVLEEYINTGMIKPLEYEVMEGTGWEAVINAVNLFEAGKVKTKAVIRLQSD